MEIEKRKEFESRLSKHEDVEKQQRKSTTKLERQLDSATQKCQQLEQLNAKLLAQLRDARAAIAENENQLASLNDDCAALREDLKNERISGSFASFSALLAHRNDK